MKKWLLSSSKQTKIADAYSVKEIILKSHMEHNCQNYLHTCPIVVLGQICLSITMVLFTSVCFFLQVMRRVAYIYQNKGQFIIHAKFLFNLT